MGIVDTYPLHQFMIELFIYKKRKGERLTPPIIRGFQTEKCQSTTNKKKLGIKNIFSVKVVISVEVEFFIQ